MPETTELSHCARALESTAPAESSAETALHTLHLAVGQLVSLLKDWAGSAYPTAQNQDLGSIGEHVRHIIDHVRAVVLTAVSGSPRRRVDFRIRARGSAMERDPAAAVDEIQGILNSLASVTPNALEGQVTVHDTGFRGASVPHDAGFDSTLPREIFYVAQHTTHHLALIRALLPARYQQGPSQVGVAAATMAYRHELE